MPDSFAPDFQPAGSLEIHCIVNGPIQTNTYFVVSEGEALAIDPAWDGEELFSEFRRELPGVRIKAAVCTHGHADHVGGVAGMRGALRREARDQGDSPCFEYLLPEQDAGLVAPSIEWQRAGWGFDTPDPGAPSRLLREGDRIEVGDAVLQVMATPGHTPGGIVLFCAATTGLVAFVGDTLFPGGHGRTDLEGGSESQIIRSLGKIGCLLPPETLCLAGHGGPTTIEKERSGNLFMHRGMRRMRKETGLEPVGAPDPRR